MKKHRCRHHASKQGSVPMFKVKCKDHSTIQAPQLKWRQLKCRWLKRLETSFGS